MDEALTAHPLAHPRPLEELGDVVLEDARPDAGLDVLAASVLEDDGVDACDVEQLREREAGGSGAHDGDLRPVHAPPAPRSNSAAWPCPTPTHIVAIPYRPPRRRSSWSSVTTRRAPLDPERVPDRDRAAIDVDPLLVDPQLAHHGERLRGERLVQLHEIDLAELDAGSLEQPADGGDRSDPHHGGVDSRDGRADERSERLDAERPGVLLARDHERGGAVVDPARVARRHRPAVAEGRPERGELLGRRVRTRVLVAIQLAGRHELVGEAALVLGLRPAPLRAEGERILVVARDVPALGDVLPRLAHRLPRVPLLVPRIREAPAERRVVHDAVAPRVRRVGLGRHQRRPRHRLDASRDEEVAVPGDHRVARADDCGEPGRAQAVHGHPRDRLRQSRQQRREPSDVAVVLPGLVRAAEPDVLDLRRRDARALDGGRDRECGEVVGSHRRKPAAVPADRRSHRREDDRAAHGAASSSITRCAMAKAPLAAGTPQ